MFKTKKQYLGRDVSAIKQESRIGYAALSKTMGISESALRMWTSKARTNRQINERYSEAITEIIVGLNENRLSVLTTTAGRLGDCSDKAIEVSMHEKLSNAAKRAWVTRRNENRQLRGDQHIMNEAAEIIASETSQAFPCAILKVKAKTNEANRLKDLSDDMLALVFRRIIFTDDKVDALCMAMVKNFREAVV